MDTVENAARIEERRIERWGAALGYIADKTERLRAAARHDYRALLVALRLRSPRLKLAPAGASSAGGRWRAFELALGQLWTRSPRTDEQPLGPLHGLGDDALDRWGTDGGRAAPSSRGPF